jgi:hypothetical protein
MAAFDQQRPYGAASYADPAEQVHRNRKVRISLREMHAITRSVMTTMTR